MWKPEEKVGFPMLCFALQRGIGRVSKKAAVFTKNMKNLLCYELLSQTIIKTTLSFISSQLWWKIVKIHQKKSDRDGNAFHYFKGFS